MVLIEKGIAFDRVEVNPFAPDAQTDLLSPFGHVPMLRHDDFHLYETAAITRYLDAAFAGPVLTPAEACGAARMQQVISILDGQGYAALVRQVAEQVLFNPREGLAPDPAVIATGLAAGARVLQALDQIAAEGLVLDPDRPGLADFHLAPMLDYLSRTPQGAALLARYPSMKGWWQGIETRASVQVTRPVLPG